MQWMAFFLTIVLSWIPLSTDTAGYDAYEPYEPIPYMDEIEWEEETIPEEEVGEETVPEEADEPSAGAVQTSKSSSNSSSSSAEKSTPADAAAPALTFTADHEVAEAWANDFEAIWASYGDEAVSWETVPLDSTYSYPTLLEGTLGNAVEFEFYIEYASGAHWCLLDFMYEEVPLRQADTYNETFSKMIAAAVAAYDDTLTRSSFNGIATQAYDLIEGLLSGRLDQEEDDTYFYSGDIYISVKLYDDEISCFIAY